MREFANNPIEPAARKPVLGLLPREWALIVVALALATLPSVMPVMVGILANQRGLGVERAGYVVSMNMGGIFAGTLVCALLSRHVAWGRLLMGGLVVMVLGNALTMLGTGYAALLVSRVFSGFGEGVASAIAYALMGKSRLPARTLAVYAAGQGVIGSIGMATLPALVASQGWQVFYVAVSLLAVPAFVMVPIAARLRGGVDPAAPSRAAASRAAATWSAWGALASIFVFFLGLAALWAFLQPLGASRGLSVAQISSALSASAIAGFVGSVVVGWAAGRLSTLAGTAIGLATVAASVVGLWVGTPAAFFAGACLLSFAWAFEYPFLFRCLAAADDAGNVAVLTPAATGGALTAGSAVGGFVLQHGGDVLLCGLGVGAAALGSGIVMAIVTRKRPPSAELRSPRST